MAGDTDSDEFAHLALPDSYQAITVHKEDADMFDGLETKNKDPRNSLHLDDVPIPELAPGEALVAVMASSINYNTVWTSIFEALPTFGFLERYGRISDYARRQVVAHVLSAGLASHDGHTDPMMDPDHRSWGFDTHSGGLAQMAIGKGNQLMPKPDHLT